MISPTRKAAQNMDSARALSTTTHAPPAPNSQNKAPLNTPAAEACLVTVDVHLAEAALHQIADELRAFGAAGLDA
ncbi:MAG: hypothetical protein ABSG50_04140 [Opitutaceae bacterium]|jgi:hypothetical protein